MSTLEIPSSRTAGTLATAVSAVDITRTYGRGAATVHALRGVSVELVRGELTVLTGPPGSGKSTLMHVLAGLEPPTTGELRIGDLSLRGAKPARMRRHRRAHVGFVYQFFNVLPHLSAEQNILRPFEAADVEPDLPWVAELLDLIGLDDSDTASGRLSPGDQQKVAIARALALRPTVLYADEPTGTVGSCAHHEILELLRTIVSSYGQTVVLATDAADIAAIADRVLVLADGLIVDELAP
jgi:putative ABC transport system ATP-binding protein